MKKLIFPILLIITAVIGFLAGRYSVPLPKPSLPQAIEKPLEKYTFTNLNSYGDETGIIKIGDILKTDKKYVSYQFTNDFHPTPLSKEIKTTSGLINIPTSGNKLPAIIMLRGYVDPKIYNSGVGTRRAGEFFASNGFITVAPDFLGYAGSSREAEDIFESRFQTYTTAISIISSLNSLDSWDKQNIFIWAHSNGGQIALSLLEIKGYQYPTVLWAPVSKPFPFSILYYTDEADDKGKFLRHELAKFESLYDVDLYSIHKYFAQIQAPIHLDQGTSDDAVPVEWSKSLINTLKGLNKNAEISIYSGADHNLNPSWNEVVTNDLKFFQSRVYNPSHND